MKSPLLDLLTQNIFTLRTVFAAAHTIKNKVSLTEAYLIVLLFEAPMKRSEITKKIHRDYSHVAHIVRNLTSKGFISKDPATETISLTPSGVSLYQEIITHVTNELEVG